MLLTQSILQTNGSTSFNPGKKCVSKSPAYLQDYHCYSLFESSSSTLHPLSKFLSYEKLSHAYFYFVNLTSTHEELETYAQASTGPRWQGAMSIELQAL